ncbi:sialate O-acetylesterase [Confluentibacter flavum]|uniref:Sialate O-acetylesterase n=1 Tax=Confluentibacter flavum TaxID=1909700 RepID=A0A2N3HP08_9FLAO|nr:sialate O-acetylesterase [Confluentibacter flavum]PKQ46686.1 sialate O-acetylesterase [Confluentibacter flavum]
MKKLLLIGSLIFSLFFTPKVVAIIRLPPIISSGMVLQQNSEANLWGWAGASERFIIISSWKEEADTVQTSNIGKWKASIKTPSAGGPYTITFQSRSRFGGGDSIVLEDIMIGEVWILSGQSNMEMSNNSQIKEILPNSANVKMRFFRVDQKASEHPQDYADGDWVSCNEETLRRFCAAGYFFGKKLQDELGNIPIGLIQSTWSGTPIELWEPASVIESDPVMKKAASEIVVKTHRPHQPGYIYNAMIYPISNYSIAGAVWYQGESNTPRAYAYEKMLTGMIGAWREAFQKDFPFYYVQIAPWKYETSLYEGALLQEAQSKSLSYPKTGMVVVTDLVDDVTNLHPQNKKDVGERLAILALADTYGKDIPVYTNPMLKSMEVNKGKVNLYFDNASNGFITKNGEKPTEFLISGSDKNFVPADVKLEKDRIIVSSKHVKEPIAVRFSFSNTGMSNVLSKEGFPIVPFRTDTWEVDHTQ